jgi:VIT1/CCC1 family predicted Fe2+/Mn2+ transporter
VLATGVAGLLAGALSMVAGEYVSVRSQRELLDASAPDPAARAAIPHLDVNANELALVYRARGMTPADATHYAAKIISTQHIFASGNTASMGVVRDGHDKHETVGTSFGVAVSSFCFFASGAIIPVIPYALGIGGLAAVFIACVLVGLALLLTGTIVGILSGASPVKRALRQLGIGFGAAAVTYLLGLLLGASTIS